MSNLRKNVLKSNDVLLAEANFRNADYANHLAMEKHEKTKKVRNEALKTQRLEKAKAEKAYNEAVQKALERAKEHFRDRKFTAIELERFLDKDVSWQEFSSWAWHHCSNKYNHTELGFISHHLPKGIRTTGPRTVTRRFAELDENGQIIPGTEITKEYEDCALYWFK